MNRGYDMKSAPIHPADYGDQIDRIALWDKKPDFKALAGKPVRMVIEVKDADLYSFRFIK